MTMSLLLKKKHPDIFDLKVPILMHVIGLKKKLFVSCNPTLTSLY